MEKVLGQIVESVKPCQQSSNSTLITSSIRFEIYFKDQFLLQMCSKVLKLQMLLGLLLALLLIPSVPGKRGQEERERGHNERGRGGGEADWRREQERRREQEEYEEYEYEYQQQEQQGEVNSRLQVGRAQST